MPEPVQAKYKSPLRKVLKILEQGRDNWKAKYIATKEQNKYLQNKLRRLELSQQEWKRKAQQAADEFKELQRMIVNQNQPEAVEVKKTESAGQPAVLKERVAHHTYSVGHALLYLQLILAGANCLRTAPRSLSVVLDVLGMPFAVPSWYSARLWLMRVGYYKLNRAKTLANDWIWIVDFSIQQGKEKCLVILGIRQRDLPPVGQALRHEDMEPISLVPVKQANGEIVWQLLNDAVAKTGVPRAIVSDRGTDLNAGIQRFCAVHPETAVLYDIKHKVACMLKQRLEKDARWEGFTDHANRLKKQVQQTEYSHLAPPALRTKARYMNLAERIDWAQRALALMDAEAEGSPLKEKLGGLDAYRPAIAEWAEMHRVVTRVERVVSTQGLDQRTPVNLALEFKQEPPLRHPINRRFRHELLRFVRGQAAQCRAQERLPGSSEVLESVFGKQKRLEGEQSKSGFTGLLLAVPAIVAELNADLVKVALENTPVKAVLAWKEQWLGETLQARRKKAFADLDPHSRDVPTGGNSPAGEGAAVTA